MKQETCKTIDDIIKQVESGDLSSDALTQQLTSLKNSLSKEIDRLLFSLEEFKEYDLVEIGAWKGRAALINNYRIIIGNEKDSIENEIYSNIEYIEHLLKSSDETIIEMCLSELHGFYQKAEFWLPF